MYKGLHRGVDGKLEKMLKALLDGALTASVYLKVKCITI